MSVCPIITGNGALPVARKGRQTLWASFIHFFGCPTDLCQVGRRSTQRKPHHVVDDGQPIVRPADNRPDPETGACPAGSAGEAQEARGRGGCGGVGGWGSEGARLMVRLANHFGIRRWHHVQCHGHSALACRLYAARGGATARRSAHA